MSREETCQHKVIVMFVKSMYLYCWITAAIHVVTELCIIKNCNYWIYKHIHYIHICIGNPR